MSDDGQVKVVIEGDSSSLVDAGAKGTQAIAGVKQETGDLSQSLPEGSALWAKYKNILGETGKEAGIFNLHSHGTRMIAAELNRIIPGLGLAFRGLTMAMLPIAAIALAIQAAVTWWKIYRDEIEAVANAQAAALDKMRKATSDAVVENTNFAKAMEDTGTAAEKLNTALSDQQTILNAQIKARKDLLKAYEDAELALAKSPQEKEAIQKKYAGLGESADDAGRQEHLGLLRQARDIAQSKQDAATKERELMNWQLTNDANVAYTAEEKNALNIKIAAKDKEIEDLKKESDRLNRQISTTGAVGDIEGSAEYQRRTVKQSQEIFSGATGAADKYLGGGSLDAGQQQLLMVTANLATGHSNTLDQAAKAVHAIEGSNSAILTTLERLAAAAENTRVRVATLEHQVAAQVNSAGMSH
jgi:hypothetical protein